MILSINRFERKKNIELAVNGFAALSHLPNFDKLRLVIAGGYDPRVSENVGYLQELRTICTHHSLVSKTFGKDQDLTDAQVLFIPSFTENQRSYLLGNSECLVYTPSNEHFGIVPLEAMYGRLPVLAVNSGTFT
jgi:alpha-1,3/alpha-1,6-mannosyltransferase